MILKKSVIAVVTFCIVCTDGVFGTSYSKVYVNSGSNIAPYQYVGYGVPNLAAYGPPIAQLSAAPAGSAVPYPHPASFVQPCVSPCVPQQPVAQVANAGLVAYSAPIAQVAVARDVPSNYEYSYVVYDDGTGDQKAAREQSDGGVVRGQYSFLQPDGYVREVQYTADDVTGFNAVVNYLPGSGEKTVEVKEAVPCIEVKSEALTEIKSPKEEMPPASEEKTEGSESEEKKPAEELPASGEQASSEEKPSEGSSGEAPAPEIPASKESAEAATPEKPTPETSASKEEGSKEENRADEPGKEETPAAEKPAKEEEAKPSKEAEAAEETVPAVVTEEKPHEDETAEEHAKHSVEAAPAIVTSALPPGYVSYEQLLNCIQKMQNTDLRVNSPLTYILLPTNARLC